MNMTTNYLGFKLDSPIIPGASPLVDDIDVVRRLEDAGAPMIVMHSLFEEQIAQMKDMILTQVECTQNHDAEAQSYFPEPMEWRLGPEEYLEQIQKIKKAVAVPVVASLNGSSNSGWLEYAKKIEAAGADALELNVYFMSTNWAESGEMVEERLLGIVQSVKRSIKIPVAVKLSPFFSSLPNVAHRLDAVGADGIVLFNRFYQPDIDIENLEVIPRLYLSDSSELLLRLRWMAILSGRVKADLAVTGGVHTAEDVLKSVMCGAKCVQVVSALLRHGPEYLKELREALAIWMERYEFDSVEQITGNMNLSRSPNPAAFERANYAKMLQSWQA